MKRIHYTSGSVLTGDEAADTLLEYAAALARNGTADTVVLNTVPTVQGEQTTRFLVGPASELVASGEQTLEAEPDNSEAIAYMKRQIARIDGKHSTGRQLLDGVDF